MQKIVPHLWFDRRARDAVTLYMSAFGNSEIVSSGALSDTPSGTVEIVVLDLAGQQFQLLFAGSEFKFTPAISFLAACTTEQETELLWQRLSDGGQVLMPFSAYPFSKRYGWTQDRYGLSWQVMWVTGRDIKQRITPFLMFTGGNVGKAEEAMRFYTSLFPDSRIGDIARYGADRQPDKQDTVMFGRFTLAGQQFAAMDSAHPHGFAFNEAISFMVSCENQAEIDGYWNGLAVDPDAGQCGWLKDRYGLSWQIVPAAMREMMSRGSREQIARVTNAFLQMKKFDLATLERAYDGR
jgi:predicted 3-demethylubiquinone-9 3-methyltransferase (glyoxalase superfamily)